MRFVLDHDVDADVVTALDKAGHQCWTASGAGLHRAKDDELTAYACDSKACLITHDREFSVRRKANVVGHHIWLTCNEWDAATVLLESLPDILPMLERHSDIMFTLKPRGALEVHRGWV